MKANIFNYATKKEQDEAMANEIASCLLNITERDPAAYLLLSGGTTPGNMYEKLFSKSLPWDKIKIFLVDERLVKTDDAHSNEKMIREKVRMQAAEKAVFTGMVLDSSDADNNLEKILPLYAEIKFNNSVVVLGMGTDGHFASLFPNDDASSIGLQNNAPILVNSLAPNEPKRRISLSAPYLCQSPAVFLMITGDDKRQILEMEEKKLPIHILLQHKPEVKVFFSS
jgi:6-phosphogluconolactonase